MIRNIFILLALTFAIASCSHKTGTNTDVFSQGKRVKTGLIWQQVDINEAEILNGYQKVEIYREDFTTPQPSEWDNLGGEWVFRDGKLFSSKALNKNFVLKTPLPQDAVISLTLRSESDSVDIKFNAWGDGKQHEHGDGYSFILGGWHNRISVISRLNEHEKNRYENRDKLKKNTEYHCKVIRKGKEIYWFVNGKLFLVYYDKTPLKVRDGQKYFSLGNWKSRVWIDDIVIEKLEKR